MKKLVLVCSVVLFSMSAFAQLRFGFNNPLNYDLTLVQMLRRLMEMLEMVLSLIFSLKNGGLPQEQIFMIHPTKKF